MITQIVAVRVAPATAELPERFEIGFLDVHERSWFVSCPTNPTADQLSKTLMAAVCIATDPKDSISLGLITREMLDRATAARDQMRLVRSKTSGTVQ